MSVPVSDRPFSSASTRTFANTGNGVAELGRSITPVTMASGRNNVSRLVLNFISPSPILASQSAQRVN